MADNIVDFEMFHLIDDYISKGMSLEIQIDGNWRDVIDINMTRKPLYITITDVDGSPKAVKIRNIQSMRAK